MSGFLHTQGHWTEAVTLGQAALAAARTAGYRHGQAWTLHQLGVVQQLTGDYPAAAASLTRALQLFCDLGHRRGQAWALHELENSYSYPRHAPKPAATSPRRSASPATSAHRSRKARALEGTGRCHVREGNPGQGAADLRQALAIYRRTGAPETQRVETTLLNKL